VRELSDDEALEIGLVRTCSARISGPMRRRRPIAG
jgi:hypothetical protein